MMTSVPGKDSTKTVMLTSAAAETPVVTLGVLRALIRSLSVCGNLILD